MVAHQREPFKFIVVLDLAIVLMGRPLELARNELLGLHRTDLLPRRMAFERGL
jgi:hypothetical protein